MGWACPCPVAVKSTYQVLDHLTPVPLTYYPLLTLRTVGVEPLYCTFTFTGAPLWIDCALLLKSPRSAVEGMVKLWLFLPTLKWITWSEPTAAVVTPVNVTVFRSAGEVLLSTVPIFVA